MKEQDLQYMRHALELAEKGRGRTSPNPCVGAVIVRDGKVVGRGYHRRAGTPHAEVLAIADAGKLARGATLYVTLEPCNHTGRTPPCTQAILKAGISRVMIGMRDPNPRVNGGGCLALRERGVKVEAGILEKDCVALNRPFIKHTTTGLPWVVMKAGMSLDAKISPARGRGGRITGSQSAAVTHRLRDALDAILVGVDTAITDNPSLTARLEDREDARDPLRVILDTNLRLPPKANVLTQHSSAPTWIFCGLDAPAERERDLAGRGAVIHRVAAGPDGRIDLRAVLSFLGGADVCSVLVEGGAAVHASLLAARLVDELYLFVAPYFIGAQGVSLLGDYTSAGAGSVSRFRMTEARMLGGDILIHGFFDAATS
jgi:diaminohydroxyphosphoribosylaminopyrimidine deaminase/5-amino-6-(5-phosphoribosylamino)uracil reductase